MGNKVGTYVYNEKHVDESKTKEGMSAIYRWKGRGTEKLLRTFSDDINNL